ncbi:MAG: hypothetical protein RLO50_05480 [Azospirillaceae bacterium]
MADLETTAPGPATTGAIREAMLSGEVERAAELAADLLAEAIGQPVTACTINRDIYSLNSVNGFAKLADGTAIFFKFHQEEGEEAGVAEYYNARVLSEAGYDVDLPLAASHRPGRQVLTYRRRHDRRLSDVCSALERQADDALFRRVVAAQQRADTRVAKIALETLHRASAAEIAREPIHQLFHRRVVDDGVPGLLGGRARRFYVEGRFDFADPSGDWSGDWRAIRNFTWRINGNSYPVTLAEAFDFVREHLDPARLGPGPAVTAHGDAHNANVWFEEGAEDRLVLFDPAFAGRHIPALLAEVKATFHNALAHPFWLYEPAEAARRYLATVTVMDGVISVETDWSPGPLREAFLESKATRFWRPLLGELAARGWLAADWEATVRAALFACPTLVMDLTAGGRSGHNRTSSAIGFAVAIMCACPPADGADPVSRFLALCRPQGVRSSAGTTRL